MFFEVKPNLNKLNEKNNYGEFVIEPLPSGFGLTLGHSLRRVLLASLEGAAITTIKIDGAKHEFSTLPGVKEDLVDLVLNIKKIRVHLEDGKENATINLDKKGPGEVKAGDIVCPTGVQILNPDEYLTTLADKKTTLKIDFTVERGKGYLLAEEKQVPELGIIAIDAIFTPVLDVDYQVSDTRVGEKTNFDKLVLKITTTGGLDPEEALKKASSILKNYYDFLVNPEALEEPEEKAQEVVVSKDDIFIEELDLPMRVVNSLTADGIKTVTELTQKTEKEVSKIKNLGAKSIKQIKEKLVEMNLNFKE